MSISGTIKSIQDTMREDVGVDGDVQRLGQLVWMLFLKVVDDRENELATLALLEGITFKSPIPEKFRWRNWAANDEGMTGGELKDFIDNELFPALQNLAVENDDPRARVVQNVFADAYNYMKSGGLIRKVINQIQRGFDFNKSKERHAFGDIYEQLLRDLQAAKNSGEFYTPRAVTTFMAQMIDPQLGESVLDPACGTGGFLTSAIEHKRENYVQTAEDEKILQNSIYGIEKKPLPHLLCTTNMILHGIDVPVKIIRDNTLSYSLNHWVKEKRVDVVLTNPPFGGTEEQGIEKNFPSKFQTRETADLFMVLIIQLLKAHGRAAVVLPDGFMFGEGIKTAIKEKLMEDCNLHTIVRLPKSVFAPYTSISTNILFFTKGKKTEHIWFYEHQLPQGVKAYNKTKPLQLKEFDTLKAWWGVESDGFATRIANQQAWKVSLQDIIGRGYNLDIKNPHLIEEDVKDPEELLSKYESLEAEVAKIRQQLKVILDEALGQ
ncbi:N-6 DNA methylase [Acinetobacter soli]|jgi:type I restriction enzyme M protein|uniref:type I restriction-modification system subunit M n=1 Tax=Acinetobacter TaxID=469 RepID=UPI000D0887DF|nr:MULTISPECIES: class I SAM-dependent DNA methyltransferase [Acinetobacter calcoaceticus/baumannii complex]AVN19362.1 SAM-dependent DNA methyltransferase [Acinetobacter pittii]MQZ37801.1 SAM-dependent DNA methyltransferase [Acinetobacter nosocomialis]